MRRWTTWSTRSPGGSSRTSCTRSRHRQAACRCPLPHSSEAELPRPRPCHPALCSHWTASARGETTTGSAIQHHHSSSFSKTFSLDGRKMRQCIIFLFLFFTILFLLRCESEPDLYGLHNTSKVNFSMGLVFIGLYQELKIKISFTLHHVSLVIYMRKVTVCIII